MEVLMSNNPRVPHRMPLYQSVLLQPDKVPNPNKYKSADFKSWYQTKWWRIARKEWLKQHPHCAICLDLDKVKTANVVDHRIPHRGDRNLFFNWLNLQSLCFFHHNSIKSALERNNTVGAKIDGNPNIPNDGW
jgi:5-methylcytosine-specific restriction endonuclease McrA